MAKVSQLRCLRCGKPIILSDAPSYISKDGKILHRCADDVMGLTGFVSSGFVPSVDLVGRALREVVKAAFPTRISDSRTILGWSKRKKLICPACVKHSLWVTTGDQGAVTLCCPSCLSFVTYCPNPAYQHSLELTEERVAEPGEIERHVNGTAGRFAGLAASPVDAVFAGPLYDSTWSSSLPPQTVSEAMGLIARRIQKNGTEDEKQNFAEFIKQTMGGLAGMAQVVPSGFFATPDFNTISRFLTAPDPRPTSQQIIIPKPS
ncbi:MAG: hypothetical protein IT443_11815 [Phycisphaeraceae bacterium]|nr:hypothetical protein [Phycisphaeraceae bacterium]